MCIDLNNMTDKNMLKEVITDVVSNQLNPIVIQLNDLQTEVKYVKKQTTETNGKVKTHEKVLAELITNNQLHTQSHEAYMESRGFSCPHSKDIADIKQSKVFRIKTKQLIIGFFSFLALLAGLTLSLLRINEQFEDKKMEKIIDMLQEKIEQNDT